MLFDLQNDPEENVNLAGTPAAAAVEEELTGALLAVWDPEKAKADLAMEKARTAIVNTWFSDVELTAWTDWPGKPEWNHIDCKTS